MKKRIVLLLIFFLVALSGCKKTEYKIKTESREVMSNGFILDGEMTLPVKNGLLPVVIIVPGSGPIDKDGTVGNQKIYQSLAHQLAKKGIASLRSHKVTYQYMQEVSKKYDFTIIDEYVYMVKDMVSIAKADPRIDSNQIYLLGHSLGSQIIPLILDEDDTLAGGIIMAGTTMHLVDLLLEQFKEYSIETYETYKDILLEVKALKAVRKGEEQYFYFGAYQAYYVNYNALDTKLIKKIEKPILIIQGEKDLQISMEHFNTYKELLKDKNKVIFKSYLNLDHLFLDIGELNDSIDGNAKAVDEKVIKDIAEFIKSA